VESVEKHADPGLTGSQLTDRPIHHLFSKKFPSQRSRSAVLEHLLNPDYSESTNLNPATKLTGTPLRTLHSGREACRCGSLTVKTSSRLPPHLWSGTSSLGMLICTRSRYRASTDSFLSPALCNFPPPFSLKPRLSKRPHDILSMSIFSKLRRAKQAADSKKEKNAVESKPPPAPYKHVPTHAATDALLGAPATWREQDKKAIQAQHKRRSEYNLSRNPSSLSNVTTLNRDQSFTSQGYAQSASNKRRHYSMDFAPPATVPRRAQVTSLGSTTNSSLRSQYPPSERSNGYTYMRRSRFDTAEAPLRAELPPRAESAMDRRIERPYSNFSGPSKDVKFYLPSSRGEWFRRDYLKTHHTDCPSPEISPSDSSENSASSSRDSSGESRASPVPSSTNIQLQSMNLPFRPLSRLVTHEEP
jgi:hypothetical protein